MEDQTASVAGPDTAQGLGNGSIVGRPPSATAEAIAAIIDKLQSIYLFREPQDVRSYLAENPDILDLVLEASVQIPKYVAPDGPFILEVLRNPEDEDDVELFAIAPTPLEPKDVLPRLHRLGREWLIPVGRHAVGRFNVDVEYR